MSQTTNLAAKQTARETAANTYLGQYQSSYGAGTPCLLSQKDRLRHLYLIGKSGVGKSSLLHNIAVQDIISGQGLCLIDPHGDLAEELLNHIPRNRLRDVVYINLADSEFPLSWNPLAASLAPNCQTCLKCQAGQINEQRQNARCDEHSDLPASTIAYGLVSACKHIWRDSWGPRMEYVLTNSFQALIEAGESMLSMPAFLSDSDFRAKVVGRALDQKVKHFFEVEFSAFDAKYRQEIISPIQNKIGQLLTHESVRNIFATRNSKIDLRFMMDSGRILIVNLAKGQIGEEPANLFGSFLLASLITTALSRSDTPINQRKPFMLLVDEFQSFSTDSFANALSEVRKYGLSLTLAHQYTGQLSAQVRQAVFGNVGAKILFAVGSDDAETLKLETRPYPHTFLLELESAEALFCAGQGEARHIHTFAPIDLSEQHLVRGQSLGRANCKATIISESRKRFCRQKSEARRVVDKILFPNTPASHIREPRRQNDAKHAFN